MGANQNYSQELGLYPKLENWIGPQPWEKRTSPGERHGRTSPQPWEKTDKSWQAARTDKSSALGKTDKS
jgi:hypothetical protein